MNSNTLENARDVLQRIWGYDSFRPLQSESIECVLNGQDSLTVLPTGGGKSLCFQAPAMCRDGLAVVISPLISLMKDQVDALQTCGVPAAFVNSTQSADEKRIVADQIKNGKLKLLYVAPERLLNGRMLEFLQASHVSFFAIDEAHCISNWGHDFRPEYRGLKVLKSHFPNASIHAFTATASGPVRDDIVAQLSIDNANVLVGDFDRPNLVYRMLRSDNKPQQIADVIARHKGESGIIYCISRKEVERTAAVLNAMDCKALPYHAGMDDVTRKGNQDAFIKEQCDVIVATVAFGMGIDKSNVRYVIHSGMPKSIEHYQQESGRAGRDGLESECILIYSPADVMTWKRIMSNDSADAKESAVKSLNAINSVCSGVKCRHRSLVEYFGQVFERDNCGACDVCLGEMDLVDDALTISQKILSCVVRLEERFGAGHTANVLTGSTAARVLELKHDQLSTYGLLESDGTKAVRLWIDQLVDQQFLNRVGEYQILAIAPEGRKLLKGNGEPKLTQPPAPRSSRRSAPTTDDWAGVDRGLFESLRGVRSELSANRNVPAYIILGDATLRELARIRPTSTAAMANIKGLGEKKLAEFGDLFLNAIANYSAGTSSETYATDRKSETYAADTESKPVTRSVDRSEVAANSVPNASSIMAFRYFRNGDSIEEVATKMGRALSTTRGYLTDFLVAEQITDSSRWVDSEKAAKIIEQLNLSEDGRMTPIYKHFEGNVTYDDIAIVKKCYENALENSPPESVPPVTAENTI
jgi:ATP-dependent DNA helicase RecQ